MSSLQSKFSLYGHNNFILIRYLEYSVRHSSVCSDTLHLCYSNRNTTEERLLLVC